MPTYQYSCARCGLFEVDRAMGTAARTEGCLTCGAPSRRSYVAPSLNRTSRLIAEAITRAERSQDQPEVVRSVPPVTRFRRAL
jgi:putative FmdB family regulatory protein